jgi:prepilin-type N-terminal cleavage/methylation domain-containing protein
MKRGFTLIELSIVLVIIGLIVSGILVGKDLITAAQTRRAITQLESFNTAVRTFQSKYNCLPGDCANAANYGFIARGSGLAQGDGDGEILECQPPTNIRSTSCETLVFWRDLADAKLIVDPTTSGTFATPEIAYNTSGDYTSYLPHAFSKTSYWILYETPNPSGGINYNDFKGSMGYMTISPGTTSTVSLYTVGGMDMKIDDGLPMAGKVEVPIYSGGDILNYITSGSCVNRDWLATPVFTYNYTNSTDPSHCTVMVETPF